MHTIGVEQLYKLQGQVELIDVRIPTEFRDFHIGAAKNVPLESMQPKKLLLERDPAQPVYVICRGGTRSAIACQKLREAGFKNVIDVEGGTLAWEKAGYPLVRGKKAIPLQRQVQTVAGTMVIIGILLSATVDKNWMLLSLFVGCGLLFAGVTGYCPMASLLARMPWNQCSPKEVQVKPKASLES